MVQEMALVRCYSRGLAISVLSLITYHTRTGTKTQFGGYVEMAKIKTKNIRSNLWDIAKLDVNDVHTQLMCKLT